MLVRREIHIQRYETVLQKGINRASGLDCELRIEFHRVLQIAQTLFEERRHLLETRSSRERAFPRRIVFLLQQRKNTVCAFVRVNLRICELELQYAIAELDIVELRAEKNPIDAVVLRPIIDLHRTHLVEERTDVLSALGDFAW